MKIACIIPSRYASTRLPGKPLRMIAGKTLVRRVYERAILAMLPDVVIVATDHKDLLAKTLVERAELDMVTVATPLKNDDYEDPSAVKVVVNQKGEALYFSRALIPYPRHDFVVPALKHIGIYAYRREFLLKYAHMKQTPLEMAESLEQLRALESGHKIGVITVETEDIGIDTEEDLKKVNAYFERSQL